MAEKVKAYSLRTQSKKELLDKLEQLKTELAQLRVAKVTGGSTSRLSKISVVRKSIARVLTVISQTERDNLRVLYKNKKYKPLDLRQKKTRAIRRRLTKNEATKITLKEKKKLMHFPMRKYAIKA